MCFALIHITFILKFNLIAEEREDSASFHGFDRPVEVVIHISGVGFLVQKVFDLQRPYTAVFTMVGPVGDRQIEVVKIGKPFAVGLRFVEYLPVFTDGLIQVDRNIVLPTGKTGPEIDPENVLFPDGPFLSNQSVDHEV